MATDDDWVTAAMKDSNLVADLLVSMKHSQPKPSSEQYPELVPFKWGHRQLRSKLSSTDFIQFLKKAARNSPTTPLSWNCYGGGASSSASDESTRVNGRCESSSRSKTTTVLNDSDATAPTIAKRYARKKTFAQLREHETALLEQSVHLKKEIATMHATVVEHRAQNKNLKRIKLYFGSGSSLNDTAATTYEPKESEIASTSTSLLPAVGSHPSASGSCHESTVKSSQRNKGFVLPDLNMVPPQDDSPPETTLNGTSQGNNAVNENPLL